MAKTYTCEICGAKFDHWTTHSSHQAQCFREAREAKRAAEQANNSHVKNRGYGVRKCSGCGKEFALNNFSDIKCSDCQVHVQASTPEPTPEYDNDWGRPRDGWDAYDEAMAQAESARQYNRIHGLTPEPKQSEAELTREIDEANAEREIERMAREARNGNLADDLGMLGGSYEQQQAAEAHRATVIDQRRSFFTALAGDEAQPARLRDAARQRVKADSPQPDSPPVDPLFAVIYEAQEVPRDLKQKVKRAMERGLVPAREAHTMTGSEYNGWTNYETWDAANRLMNTERDYTAIVGMAHGTRDAGVLARRLRSAYGFDRRTNWAEIAEYFLDAVADEA